MKKTFFTTFILTIFILVSSINAQFDEYWNQVNYKGAFGSTNWLKGWTAMDHYGYFTTAPAVGGSEETITDATINAGDEVYWTADKTYVLDGFVYVEEGAVLNIEAGTVIKAKEGQAESASALIICRGAKIYAEGTASAPIIFTSVTDDVTDPTDLTLPTSNLWGGVILLGNATINPTGGEEHIEGIPAEARTAFGGTDDEDNSGVMRYVSIRHGGTDVGSGKEINGLTLGGVGRGTTIEYIEVFNNNDDGYEWFGGTVNAKYLVSAFNADDCFDHDMGFRGKLQYLFAIEEPTFGNACGEHDGGTDPEDGTPYGYAQAYNVTFLGSGKDAGNADNDWLFNIRDFWGGFYKNSIFGDYAGKAIQIEDLATGNDCKLRLDNGEILLENNLWFDFGAGSTLEAIAENSYTATYLAGAQNAIESPALASITRTPYTQTMDPRPAADGVAYQNLASYPNDDFFDHVNYKGAFGSTNWMKGWTALDHYGYLTEDATPTNTVNVTDADINAGDKVYWTADNTYVLDGFVYVEDGAVLNIEAGTVIKAKEGQAESASALIICRGGKIYAEGTGVNPIIFTSVTDDVTDPTDLTLPTSNLWGGLILLGKATINPTGGEENIEGIPAEARTTYGGTDDEDCTGVLKYVSIRHGGTDVGSGKEINGLTFGAVGNSTTIDFIEVFNNNDDGYEWFGGNVDCRHLVSAFNADDCFDHDMGIRGKFQFLFAIQEPTFGNACGEHDGGTDPEDGAPYAFPQSYNVTFLGSGMNAGNADNDWLFNMRDYWGGVYNNSIFGDYAGKAIQIEDLATGNDSKTRLDNGEILLSNNIFFDFGSGSTFADIAENSYEANHLSANNNAIESPALGSITRTPYTQTMDPRPEAGGAAYENLAAIVTGVKEISVNDVVPADFNLSQNYPNPFNPTTNISFALPVSSQVKLVVYNVLGQKVAELVNDFKTAGTHTIEWDAASMSSGVYFYSLEADNVVVTKKMTLLK